MRPTLWRMFKKSRRGRRGPDRCQAGMGLIELMTSMTLLAVGLGGVMVMLTASITTNGRNKLDTTSTAVAQMVLEQVLAQPANSSSNITATDCNSAGAQTWTIATAGAASPGAGANVLSSTGAVDYTQAYGSVPANYAMLFVACGANGQQVTYDVRWNVRTVTTYTRLVTVSARRVGAGNGSPIFSPPITLRSIGGI